MSEREERLFRMLLGLRDPLSRIELALAGLERGAGGPAGLAPIRSALAEADARLEAALRALRERESGASEDCRGALAELAERLFAPLAARGVAFALEPHDAPLAGDPNLLRRALLGLLRAGAEWAGEHGSIRAALRSEPTRYGVSAFVSCARAAGEGFPAEPLERFALAAGGGFAAQPLAPSAYALELWLPREAAA